MKLPLSASDEEIEAVARRWIELLPEQRYGASIDVDLPLVYANYEALGDLTARIYLRLADEHMVFVLNHIHAPVNRENYAIEYSN